jgi:hypothetical protein
MDRIQLSTLGRLELTLNGRPALVRRRKELALLAYLARRAPRPADRASLASMLWSDSEDAKSRHSLSQALSDLRSVLGRDSVSTLRRWVTDPPSSDATEFENNAAGLSDAVARGRGRLAGLDDIGDERWGAWLEGERTVLNAKLGLALERLIGECEARGSWETAIPWAEPLVELQPTMRSGPPIVIPVACGRTGRREGVPRRVRSPDGEGSRCRLTGAASALDRARRAAANPSWHVEFLSPDLRPRRRTTVLTTARERTRGAGVGHVVVIEGDEGQGKSRLIAEFQHAIRRRNPDTLMLAATAFVSERQVPFAALRPLAGRLAEAPGAPGAPPASLAVLSGIWPEVRDRYRGLRSGGGYHHTTWAVVATVADTSAVLIWMTRRWRRKARAQSGPVRRHRAD